MQMRGQHCVRKQSEIASHRTLTHGHCTDPSLSLSRVPILIVLHWLLLLLLLFLTRLLVLLLLVRLLLLVVSRRRTIVRIRLSTTLSLPIPSRCVVRVRRC